MSLKSVPAHVRAHLYLFWAGLAISGAGIVGFFVSFWRVGSAEAAAVDVHTDVPVFAYASIAAWVLGLGIMWYSRRRLDAAVAAKHAADRETMFVDLGAPAATGAVAGGSADATLTDTITGAPDGREA